MNPLHLEFKDWFHIVFEAYNLPPDTKIIKSTEKAHLLYIPELDKQVWIPKAHLSGEPGAYTGATWWAKQATDTHTKKPVFGVEPEQPQPVAQPPTMGRTPTMQRPPTQAQPQGPWILAKAKVDEDLPDHNGVPHRIKEGQHVVLKNNNDGTWTYATVWKGRLQWHNAQMQAAELANRFQRVTDASGNIVSGRRASELAKSTYKEDKKKFEPTEEQNAISDRFKEMKEGDQSDHMVINALAGTGKSTTLKHLAEKYGKRGENWLYLVFGRKNREEAKEKFPDFVDVYTTHSYAGEVLNKNRQVLPTDRFLDYSPTSNKLQEIIDGPQYQQVVTQLNIPHFNSPRIGKSIKWLMRSLWREFNSEAEKLTGLAKAYNLTPENAAEGITQIAKEHDINRGLEKTKEKIQKHPQFDFLNQQVSQAMGVSDFLQEDFLDRMIKAATWLMEKTRPHGIDQEFLQTHHRPDPKSNKWVELDQPIKRNLRELRDFDDDLWFAAMHADELDWTKPKKYQYVLVDEVQDFNKAQKVILKKLIDTGARIVAVGDPNQCHPAGTLVTMTGNKQKPIEEIVVGDEVVTYNTKKSYFPGTVSQGRKIEGVACRPYKGQLINIYAGLNHFQCTPNHKCVARFGNCDKKYCLYLMVKGASARIGICRLKYKNAFGVSIRAKAERADKAWLLNVFENESEARISETVVTANFGLPQIIFTNTGQYTSSQVVINEVYKQIGNNLEKANVCLQFFGRDIKYPIWSKDKQERYGKLKQNYLGSTKSFITQACNLISDYMLVRTFDGTNRGGKWESIKVNREMADCPVYSLKVQKTEDGRRLYIANNVVVSNSMYRFRGADDAAFQDITEMLKSASANPDATTKTLTKNFRSKHGIIDHSNKHTIVDNLQPGIEHDEHDPAHISNREIDYRDTMDRLGHEMQSLGEMKKQTAFIARTNAPLAKSAMDLLKHKIPFIIYGKDLAREVVEVINRVLAWQNYEEVNDRSYLREFKRELDSFVDEKKEQWGGSAAKAGQLKELLGAQEALDASIDVIANEFKEPPTVKEFKNWLYERLGGIPDVMTPRQKAALRKRIEEENPVTLTTAHRSKGLEFERVFELTPSEYPHPRARLPADLAQEENAKYVAGTRAKDEYHIVDDSKED